MPILGLEFSVVLLRRNKDFSTQNVLGYDRGLLNIPIQSYGEEYVKRYVNRFSSR